MKIAFLLLFSAALGMCQETCLSTTCVDYVTQLKHKPRPYPGYVVNASSSPLFIPESSHLQGSNITVDCWSNGIVSGHLNGQKVYCQVALASSGNGDVTVTWQGADVGSIIISSVATPYVTTATASPMPILRSTHQQGQNIAVDCWSGPLVNNSITGNKVFCQPSLDAGGSGNVSVVWSGTDVGSIIVSGVVTQPPYVANATTSPTFVPSAVHAQGPNVSIECWSGSLVGGKITGTKVYCNPSLDISGNADATIAWGSTDVRSFIITASGPSISVGPPGPAGPVGPVGPPGPASSYFTAATSSPQSIPQSTHLQGTNPDAICFDGPVTGGTATGNVVICGVNKDSAGNFTIYWGGSTVGSIQIMK